LKDEHESLSRSANQTIASQKAQITSLSHQNSLLQDELEQYKQIAQKRDTAFEELQSRYDELSLGKEANERRATEEESMNIVREELHRQANYLRTLETTNAKLTSELNHLRERQTSVEVLREEKRGLEQRVKMLEELRTKVVQLEAEVTAGRKEREEWYADDFSYRGATHDFYFSYIGRINQRKRSRLIHQYPSPKPYLSSGCRMRNY
jgi:mitotic spindle assembly checkpoint protein MAD1